MKKKYFITEMLLLLSLSMIGVNCKKSGNDIQYVTLRVLQAKTGIPVENAIVSLEGCTHPGSFGCLEYSAVYTAHTDDNGTYKFDRNLNVDRIIASHPDYWDGGTDSWQDINLVPKAWMKLYLEKINSYPPDAIITLYTISDEFITSDPTSTLWLNYLPEDTVVYMLCYGNYKSHSAWSVTYGGLNVPGASESQQINAFDTVTVDVSF